MYHQSSHGPVWLEAGNRRFEEVDVANTIRDGRTVVPMEESEGLWGVILGVKKKGIHPDYGIFGPPDLVVDEYLAPR